MTPVEFGDHPLLGEILERNTRFTVMLWRAEALSAGEWLLANAILGLRAFVLSVHESSGLVDCGEPTLDGGNLLWQQRYMTNDLDAAGRTPGLDRSEWDKQRTRMSFWLPSQSSG